MAAQRAVTAVALSCLLLAACGRSQESSAEALAEEALKASTGQAVEIKTEEGRQQVSVGSGDRQSSQVTGENVDLPADFPDDVSLPDDYTVVSVMTMGPARSVVLRTREPMASVFEHFKSGQASQGWKETVSMQGAEGSMLGFEKGRRGVTVNLRTDIEGQTIVQLSLQAP